MILQPGKVQSEDPVAVLQLQQEPRVQELLGDTADKLLEGAKWDVLQKLEEWAVQILHDGETYLAEPSLQISNKPLTAMECRGSYLITCK